MDGLQLTHLAGQLQARKKLVSVLQGVLNKRRAAKRHPRSSMDMMDRLIEVEDEHGRRLDDEEIIDILVMYLNAGHESSGHISMWTTVFLQENPEIFAKAKVTPYTPIYIYVSTVN
jgi:ent-kaurenoic acid hydroxylase